MEFLRRRIGIAADETPLDVPIWISWAQFGPNINDRLIRQQADIAAKAGFVLFQLDDGWQRGRLGTEPDTRKFPHIEETWQYIHHQGLKLGLWLSSSRDAESEWTTKARESDAITSPRHEVGGVTCRIDLLQLVSYEAGLISKTLRRVKIDRPLFALGRGELNHVIMSAC